MDVDTRQTLNTVLILPVALLQFLLRHKPANPRLLELERRLDEAETRLETLQRQLDH